MVDRDATPTPKSLSHFQQLLGKVEEVYSRRTALYTGRPGAPLGTRPRCCVDRFVVLPQRSFHLEVVP